MENTEVSSSALVIYEFQKNKSEVVRACLTEYKGSPWFDLRVYFKGADDEYHPTRKGLCLALDRLAELRRAVEALERARS